MNPLRGAICLGMMLASTVALFISLVTMSGWLFYSSISVLSMASLYLAVKE